MVDIHLISARFNGKLAITGRNLCHSAALLYGELGVFSKHLLGMVINVWSVQRVALMVVGDTFGLRRQ